MASRIRWTIGAWVCCATGLLAGDALALEPAAADASPAAANNATPQAAPPAKGDANSSQATADSKAPSSESKVNAANQANNPLSNLTSFSYQDYAYLRHAAVDSSNRDARTTNTGWLRLAKSFGTRLLTRVSLPVQSIDNGRVSGLGDLNAIVPVIVSRPGASTTVGLGPAVTFPTHTNDALGADAYGVGGAFTFFYNSKALQIGGLATFNQNVKVDIDVAAEQSLLTFQPFLFWQVGGGYYLRSSAIMTFEVQHNVHNLPVGLGLGKIMPVAGAVIFNLYAELQQSMWSRGALQPTTQVFFGINTQLVPGPKP